MLRDIGPLGSARRVDDRGMALVVLVLGEEARFDGAAEWCVEIPAENSADDVSSIGLGERSSETAIVVEVVAAGEDTANFAD